MNQTADDSYIETEINGTKYKLTRLNGADFKAMEDHIRSNRLAWLKERLEAKAISEEQFQHGLEHLVDPRIEPTMFDDQFLATSRAGMEFILYRALRKYHPEMTSERVAKELPASEMIAIVMAMNGLVQKETADNQARTDQGSQVD